MKTMKKRRSSGYFPDNNYITLPFLPQLCFILHPSVPPSVPGQLTCVDCFTRVSLPSGFLKGSATKRYQQNKRLWEVKKVGVLLPTSHSASPCLAGVLASPVFLCGHRSQQGASLPWLSSRQAALTQFTPLPLQAEGQ